MVQPFVGEIRMFGGTFAPVGWAMCDGQLLQVSANQTLFSLLGTSYGGDGRTTFALPDLRGRVPLHQGSGIGLTPRVIGARSGSERVAVGATQLPSHTHAMKASANAADEANPAGAVLAAASADIYVVDTATAMDGAAVVADGGGGSSHNNMAPYAVVNFIIALSGIFPS